MELHSPIMKAIATAVVAAVLNSAAVFGQGELSTSSVVYEQLPFHHATLAADGAVVRWADDFQLPQTALIQSVLWWGTGEVSAGDFTLTLYSDDAGKPGIVMPEFSLGTYRVGEIAVIDPGISAFHYVGLLQEPVELPADTRYWLSIAHRPVGSWNWTASISPPASVQVNGGPWELAAWADAGAAFALSTDVPEAPAALCLIIGIAGVWVRGRARHGGPKAEPRSWRKGP
jgi:hypothetical protein